MMPACLISAALLQAKDARTARIAAGGAVPRKVLP